MLSAHPLTRNGCGSGIDSDIKSCLCTVKLAAGWLIDRAGWRGHVGAEGVAVHHQQALVLTNSGRAPGGAVLALAEEIRASVMREYGVNLEMEPRIYP
jgi:UDP-N-acetylmuramate dehydrogenase